MADQMTEREVNDVATLKALADPVRLSILNALWKHDPEPLSVKEIAAELDEAPTKLYRHVKQLEQTGLIVVAETRLVSGIVESRYRTGQKSLRLSREVFGGPDADRPAVLDAMLASMDSVRSGFQAGYLADRIDLGRSRESPYAGVFSHFAVRVRPERLARLRADLLTILDELADEEPCTDQDAVDATLFTLLYAVKPADED